jgi:nucleotide-binding universal stress UspA family protein
LRLAKIGTGAILATRDPRYAARDAIHDCRLHTRVPVRWEDPMRLPVTTETDAFRAVLVVALLCAVCVLVGYLFGVAPAAVLAGLAAIGLAVWILLPSRTSLSPAEASGRRRPGAARTLLIVGEAPTDEQFAEEVLHCIHSPAALEVHAPVLQSKTHFVTTDIDHETRQARRRLAQTLAAARRAGVPASGEVGDPIDPLAGIEDELRRYRADEVIVTTHPRNGANWIESDLLEHLRAELAAPVREVILGDGVRSH